MDKLPDINVKSSGMMAKVSMVRINRNLKATQYWLDSRVMDDMTPLMPRNTSAFINVTRAQSAAIAGSGWVVAAAPPFGRYLYYGRVMVDSETGKGPMYIPNVGYRFKKGARLVATSRPLTYSNPSAVPEWFEAAKKKHKRAWIKGVKERAAK